jgi:hypothetical protein
MVDSATGEWSGELLGAATRDRRAKINHEEMVRHNSTAGSWVPRGRGDSRKDELTSLSAMVNDFAACKTRIRRRNGVMKMERKEVNWWT